MLLEAPEGTYCSLECLDDIAEDRPGKGVRLVQSKSALAANPVADRAKSLWKTLSNWLALRPGQDYPPGNVIFEIYVSRPVGGKLVEAFHNAASAEQAFAAITLAREELWGAAPEFPLRREVAKEISSYVDRVFQADQSHLVGIIRSFRLICGSGGPNSDLEFLIATHPVRKSKVKFIADYISGVVKRRIDERLEKSIPAILSRDEIHSVYSAFCRKIDSDAVLMTYAKRPTKEQVLENLPQVFVRQLDAIELDYDDKLEAINDYLMASVDRTEWAMRGDVDESSYDELNDKLARTWKNKQRMIQLAHHALPAEQQGELLYRDCMNTKELLQAKDTPGHFIPGCLHRLADDLTIGWHPAYQRLLKAKRAA